METVMGLGRNPHTVVHCVPLEGEQAEFAPMYFKKAIQDCDEQWSQHKKVETAMHCAALRRGVSCLIALARGGPWGVCVWMCVCGGGGGGIARGRLLSKSFL
jgi:hypothetical protein